MQMLFSSDALYIGVSNFDAGGKVSSRLARRDAYLPEADEFSVALDSRHDHQTAFRFSVDPAGVKSDAMLSSGSDADASWDAVWDAATSISKIGWTAEIRIPLSELRFASETEQVWAIQFTRRIGRNREQPVFAFTPRKERGGIPRYGHLVGLGGIQLGRRLEALPYAVLRAAALNVPQSSEVGFPNPYRNEFGISRNFGVDLKYRLTSNLVVDATINPDFGQVKADPAEVNLTAFETQLAERRPFFVEGADIFNFGGSRLFDSRRIGRRPQGTVPRRAIYRQIPKTSTIVGAAKLSGKTANGWTLGLLEVVTGAEQARFVDRLGDEYGVPVEPLSNYFVGRARRDFRSGQTVVGAIVTSTHRALSDSALASRLRSSAYAVGVEFKHEWANRTWSANGFFASSSILGEWQVITAAQRSSARYYHRPDAEHLALDPTANSLSGYNARFDEVSALDFTGRAAWCSPLPVRVTKSTILDFKPLPTEGVLLGR